MQFRTGSAKSRHERAIVKERELQDATSEKNFHLASGKPWPRADVRTADVVRERKRLTQKYLLGPERDGRVHWE